MPRLPRFRFTTQHLIIAVAVAALLFAAWSQLPRHVAIGATVMILLHLSLITAALASRVVKVSDCVIIFLAVLAIVWLYRMIGLIR